MSSTVAAATSERDFSVLRKAFLDISSMKRRQYCSPQYPSMKGPMTSEWTRSCWAYDVLLENLECLSFPWGQMWQSSRSPWNPSFLRVSTLACPSRRCQMLMLPFEKGWQGIGTFIVSLAPEWIGFQEFGASITCFLLCRKCSLQFH